MTSEVLTSWYQERAREIEQYAGQVGLGRGPGRPGEGALSTSCYQERAVGLGRGH